MMVERSKEIYLAGGCFWGVDAYMSRISGIKSTSVGYANGDTENPTYEQVCTGNTGYVETVHVVYDPSAVSLSQLLSKFFDVIEPTEINRQGNDVGNQYRTGIYYVDKSDVDVIRKVIDEQQKLYDVPIATEVMPLKNYYPGEEYHQKYLVKNPNGYCHIKLDL